MREQSPGRKRRLPPAAIAAIIVAAICGISLYIRLYLPHDQIFVNDWVWFRETDAYYHLRHIESLVHNFPRFNVFDPYILFPWGGEGTARPFFDWIVAGIVLLVSRGAPAQHTIETVSAYMPAILGTLTIIPVYFIGKELFNRWVGVISAALVAILPGEFLHRSLLGFTDHHVAETLFSTAAVLFLIMAVKRAREREISFSHLLSRDWSTVAKPLIYTLLAGVFLGMYLLSWIGGLLFIFIIFAYLVIQFIVDHLRRKSTDYLCIIGSSLFLIASLMLLPVMGDGWAEAAYRVSLPAAIVIPIFLCIISRLLARRALKPAYYPVILLGLVGIGLAALRAVNPSLLKYIIDQFGIFAPTGVGLTVLEMHPLSLTIAWTNFTTSFFISFISLAMLGYVVVRERSADKTLFLVWSIVMLAAVLGQRRFGYYFAVNAALLTGYFSWRVLDFAGLSKLLVKTKEAAAAVWKSKKKRSREKAKRRTSTQPGDAWVKVIVAGVAIFFLVFFPNIGITEALAGGPHFIGQWFDQGWYSSLLWLKDNSPEPFPDPDFYYELYETPFDYPDSAYGVMSWWDYGHFIMQISRRIPNANPMQYGAEEAGQFFTAQDESSASEIADRLGSKYVVIDHMMATSKFYAMVEWAGKSVAEFWEVYYEPTGDGWLTPVVLYYPAYYRSAVVRLYSFGGQAVVPVESTVISYENRVSPEGISYKEVIYGQAFPSYEQAEAYIARQASGNYRIVGTSPFNSPVPLEELKNYRLVHESDARVEVGDGNLPGVKIFEYLGH